MMQRILIIEDDRSIAEIERDYLEAAGFAVHMETDGLQGRDEALRGKYDLILLDLMLPGMDGFDVCSALRRQLDIPILMVTARLEDADKIRGLGLGADDYIEKPFSPRVLVARVQASLAHHRRAGGGRISDTEVLSCRQLRLNTLTREVTVEGRSVELKNREYELLYFLMRNVGQVFSRETLYDRVWGLEACGDSATVAVHINRLREKLHTPSAEPDYIQTIRGAGYRLI